MNARVTQPDSAALRHRRVLWIAAMAWAAGVSGAPLRTDAANAGVCGARRSGPCCAPAGNGSPGCAEVDCCTAVCDLLPACCTLEWDAACAASAQLLCPSCCPATGGCDDGNACTLDSCDTLSGRCVFEPLARGSACEGDGNRCTIEECNGVGTCAVILDRSDRCQQPVPPCEGGEFCNPVNGRCEALPDTPAGVLCDADGDLCTLDECTGLGGCATVDTITCASACPLCRDSCDPRTGACPCVEAAADGPWSSDIWNLEGPLPYPDNLQGIAELGVVIANSIQVILDVSVEIQSLCVLDGAILRRSDPLAGFGDDGHLTIAGPEGIFLENAEMLVADNQIIDCSSGPLTLSSGGSYRADPAAPPLKHATLTAANITIHEGPSAGSLQLRSEMAGHSLGNLVMDGTLADKKGSCTPPDLNVLDGAVLAVAGDLEVIHGATIEYTSSEPLQLGGNFLNHSVFPQWFDWPGAIHMTAGEGSTIVQTFEAAGRDQGRCLTGLAANFALGKLQVGSAAAVLVVDDFDNQQDTQAECEAVYVAILAVDRDAVLETSGCRVYYSQLINLGSIPGLGTDVLPIEPADFNGDCRVNAADLAQLLGAWGACPEPCPPSYPLDLVPNCAVDAADLAMLLGHWGPVN